MFPIVLNQTYSVISETVTTLTIASNSSSKPALFPKSLMQEYVDLQQVGKINLFKKGKDRNEIRTIAQEYSKWASQMHSYNGQIIAMVQFILNHPGIVNLEGLSQDECILPSPKSTQEPIKAPTQPLQMLLFGPPGTGKSYQLQQWSENHTVFRSIFHPDMTYASFIGAYKPTMLYDKLNTENLHSNIGAAILGRPYVDYQFVPGIFLLALKEALLHPTKSTILILEEMNRANATAVFAEVFQLLDRVDEIGKNDLNWSQYPINPEPALAYWLHQNLQNIDITLKQMLGISDIFEPTSIKLRLPPNFYVWATMNAADQSVFPLDTAFKRRWSMLYISADGTPESQLMIQTPIWDPLITISKQTIHWQQFRQLLNLYLQNQCQVDTDRLLGPFFLSQKELTQWQTSIPNKVLPYIREDVLRFQSGLLFLENISLHQLVQVWQSDVIFQEEFQDQVIERVQKIKSQESV